MSPNRYFWRTWEGAEVDYIEEEGGKLSGYEFKWSKSGKNTKASKLWLSTYEKSSFEVVNKDNILEFVTEFKD